MEPGQGVPLARGLPRLHRQVGGLPGWRSFVGLGGDTIGLPAARSQGSRLTCAASSWQGREGARQGRAGPHLCFPASRSFNAGAPIRDDVNPTGRLLFEREQEDLLHDLYDIPARSCDRRVNEFVKRVR